MSQLRAWFGDAPEYKTFSSKSQAIKFVKKLLKDYDEEECGLEEFLHGEWDEWLDEDDQNIHEYLYMIANDPEMDLESEEDDFDEDEEDSEEVEDFESPEDDFEDEDRLINAISGNVSHGAADEEEFDEDEDLDDGEEDDFDEDDDEDEDA